MEKKRGQIIFSTIMVLCFGFAFSIEQLVSKGNIEWTVTYVASWAILSFVCGVLAGILLTEGLVAWQKYCAKWQGSERYVGQPLKMFIISFLLIVLAWFPVYLAYFPGICAYDFTIQSGQFVSHEYTDHHPIAHTLLMEGFYRVGETLGSATLGIGMYVLFQLLLLAAAMAYSIVCMRKWGTTKLGVVIIQLFAMFFPFNWYLSISATKDTIFTAAVLVMLTSFIWGLKESKDTLRLGKWDAVFVISAAIMILFRNNGKYAFLVVMVFLAVTVLFSKKKRAMYVRLLTDAMVAFFVGCIIVSMLFRITDATQGDKREMLSVPIQQLARTTLYHGGVGFYDEDDGTMSAEDKALIDAFLPGEAYLDYRPDIADPVKRQTYTHVFRYQFVEFITTYLNLFVGYPGDYINSFLAQNAGFLYPFDETHAHINESETEQGLGYVQTRFLSDELNPRGIYEESKWVSLKEKLESWANKNSYLELPVLKYIFMPGIYVWAYLLVAGYLLWKRKYGMLLPFTFIMGYYITLLLGPTVQLRYIYPVMVSLPLFVGLSKETESGRDIFT